MNTLMTATPTTRTSVLRNERGAAYLAQNMVGAFISLLVLGVVAAAIMGAGSFQTQTAMRSAVTNQASATDVALRADLTWASVLDVTDKTSFTAVVPGANGNCRVSDWEIRKEASGRTAVVNTVYNYGAYEPNSNPVLCKGQPSAPVEKTFITDASAGAGFTFANSAGRGLVFAAGEISRIAPGTPSPGVLKDAWNSISPTTVTLTSVVGNGGRAAAEFSFTQAAVNLDVVATDNAWEQHFIPGGKLTPAAGL